MQAVWSSDLDRLEEPLCLELEMQESILLAARLLAESILPAAFDSGQDSLNAFEIYPVGVFAE